jgi:predicted RNase H-like HicB family nuclease
VSWNSIYPSLLKPDAPKIILEPSEDGGYTVHVPALPGCISEGDTLDEARANIREAIALSLEDAEEPELPEGATVEEIAV